MITRISSSLLLAALLWPVCSRAQAPAQVQVNSVDSLRQNFLIPPDDARIWMRWWWFGPAVEDDELARELRTMKEGGVGGVEIQPVYALALDEPAMGIRNTPYLSDDFLHEVSFANQTARQLGLRVSITLGSGWPYGGPHVPITQAAGKLRLAMASLPAGADRVPLPALENGEKMIAAFVVAGTAADYDSAAAKQITLPAEADAHSVSLAAMNDQRTVLFFISSRTGQQVKRAAVGAEGFVLDHFDRAAIDNHLQYAGEPLMRVFGDQPPYSVFSDSLEVYGSDWTPDFLSEFQKRRGYDLTPYLPELFAGKDDLAKSVRHDWGETLAELIDQHYLEPLTAWAHQHHTLFRSQTYGEPAVTLSSNDLVDLPEGEGPQWRSFSYTRWATSASHLYGRDVTSAESWTWLHSPAFRAVPLDMKAEADGFFLEGVNQFVGHGWPYSPAYAGEPGYAFYAAAVFNQHNPWWPVMPEITAYLQRLSFLLRQGRPANQVAVYIPTDDAQASFTPGHVGVTEEMHNYITSELTASIMDAGYNLDYIDAEAINKLGIHYPVLVLPHVDRIPLTTLQQIAAYVQNGGKVVAVGRLPEHAPGLREAKADTPQIEALSQKLSHETGWVFAASDGETGSLLKKAAAPDMQLDMPTPEIGFIRRKLPFADVYFIANTSNHTVSVKAHFATQWSSAEEWDAFSGKSYRADEDLHLAPYESRVLVFHDGSVSLPERWRGQQISSAEIDLSHDWQVTFPALHRNLSMPSLESWTDTQATRYFSGHAIYSRDFELPANVLGSGRHYFLDFGEGKPLPPGDREKPGMHALLESPVREVALVSVNGQKAGLVWRPPYHLDVTAFLHAGKNHLEIEVANTAINTLAGRSLPDYRLLNLRYGEKFTPQDMENLKPLPSGIIGPIRLVPEKQTQSVQ
ncbi:glycosyl hydrolase [Alloacidobacterium sp.]|uniref:glycosyl hydrolase n=1 Tax=Alloacidobacterium sp. TaxID=2951999 RepID=UPI002D698051|nr:glycosyl hydrolase [Alloacidobacterium sp.]HYK34346.1 glycosyl hydrolase [Alloacidobacterium sp.]